MEYIIPIMDIIGYLLRGLGFLVIGFGLGRFTMDSYNKANWQLQATLALGFFGLLIALTTFASKGSTGAFALGAGIAFLLPSFPRKDDEEAAKKK